MTLARWNQAVPAVIWPRNLRRASPLPHPHPRPPVLRLSCNSQVPAPATIAHKVGYVMNLLPKVVWISLLVAGFFLSLTPASTAQKAQIRRVAVVKSGDGLQVEIQTSQRVMPLTQVVTDPDRLIIDFSDAVPGPELRALTVNKGAVKGVRIGRVTINPPVTRVVVDLTAPLPFQLFPSSKSVIVKLGEARTAVAAATPAVEPVETSAATPPPAHEPTLTVRPAVSEAAPANLRPAKAKAVAAAQVPVPAPASMSGITVT